MIIAFYIPDELSSFYLAMYKVHKNALKLEVKNG